MIIHRTTVSSRAYYSLWPLLPACAIATFALSLSVATVTCGAEPESLSKDQALQRVIAAWNQRQERFKKIRFVLDGDQVLAKGALSDEQKSPIPPRDITYKTHYQLDFDFEVNLIRCDFSTYVYDEKNDELRRRRYITLLNSKNVRKLRPEKDNDFGPDDNKESRLRLLKENSEKNGAPAFEDVVTTEVLPVYMSLGLFQWNGRVNSNLSRPIRANDFRVDEVYIREDDPIVNMRRMQSRENGDQTLRANVRKHGAVEQYVTSDAFTSLNSIIEISYEESDYGWLPVAWTVDNRLGNDLVSSTSFRVSDVSTNCSLDPTEVDPPAGP